MYMNNILKNSYILFVRNKEYFSSIIIAPIIMLLIFSFILSFQSKTNVGIINYDQSEFGKMIEETIAEIDFVKPLYIDRDDIEDSILNNKLDFAIIINDSKKSDINSVIKIIKSQDSQVAKYIESILNFKISNYFSENEDEINVSQNDVGEKGIPITNSLGMVIFKMLGSASLLAGLIILDKNSGIKDRIYLSKTKLVTYLTGRGLVFFTHLLLFSIIYFLTAKMFNFDFAMKYPIRILVVFAVLSILTTSYGLFLSAFANNDNTVWSIGVMALLPTSILSGALFPFEAMPETLQIIGKIFPQRWITIAIEKLQQGGSLLDTAIPLGGVLGVSLVLFLVSSIRLNKIKYC